MAVYGWKTREEADKQVKVYGAYQELIANAKADGLEAVIIALPLHLHAPAAVAAMKAGLHVITEKLMAHSVHECKEMARVAEKADLLLAVGHQRHYNILYDNAVNMIRQGLLGDLHYIRAQWHRGNMPGNDSWQQPMPEKAKPDDKQGAKAGQGTGGVEEGPRRGRGKPPEGQDRQRKRNTDRRRRAVETQDRAKAGTNCRRSAQGHGQDIRLRRPRAQRR